MRWNIEEAFKKNSDIRIYIWNVKTKDGHVNWCLSRMIAMVLSFGQQPHISQSLNKNTGLGNFNLRQNGHPDRSSTKTTLASWQSHPLYFILPSATSIPIHSSTQISLLTVSFRPLTTHLHLHFPFPRMHTEHPTPLALHSDITHWLWLPVAP